MTKRKAATKDTEDEKSYLDKLIELRTDIKSDDGLTRLLDILIDAEGGDSEALAEERQSSSEDVEDSGDPNPEGL